MNIEAVKKLAWIGDSLVKGEVRGVALEFHGLNYTELKKSYSEEEEEWGKHGILTVFPYYGPWSWMNRQAREYVDDLVESIYTGYSLEKNIPLFSTGGSMGGYSALLYARYAKHPVAACRALYPVCDLKYHYYERDDLPRTIHNAFGGYKEDMDEIFAEHSPLSQVDKMPEIPYLILHGDHDVAVNKEMHSDKMVAEMKKHGLSIEYIEVPGYGHGGELPSEATAKIRDFIYRNL